MTDSSCRRADTIPADPTVGIIALVPDLWSSYWQTRHHVLSRLARYFHVVWVEPSRHWRSALGRSGQRSRAAVPAGLTVHPAEAWLPIVYRPQWIGRLAYALRLRRARRRLIRRGCRRIVLYVWRPEFARALTLVPHDFSCYHIDDEYAFSDREVPTREEELALIHAADHVIVHARQLMAKKGGMNPRTSLVPNGVAFEAFSRPSPEPTDLAAIPRPIVGYTGYIKRELDWRLIESLATHHPEWSFVFVGPTSPHPEIRALLNDLARRNNVHFLGGKDVAALAAYPQHFDVCIMPYRMTADANYIFPLKLHEYLAAGRPTIGPPIPTLLDFATVVTLARSSAEWSDAIAASLRPSADSDEARHRRQAIAREYDWDLLVRRIARIMRPDGGGSAVAGGRANGPERATRRR